MRVLGIPAAAVLAAVLIVLPAQQVSAGLFDSVFSPGPQRPQVVGRHLVSMPPGYKPGTITVEFLPPIEPGLNRCEFMGELETRIETATDRLLAEAS